MFSIVVARTDTDIVYVILRKHPGFERLKISKRKILSHHGHKASQCLLNTSWRRWRGQLMKSSMTQNPIMERFPSCKAYGPLAKPCKSAERNYKAL